MITAHGCRGARPAGRCATAGEDRDDRHATRRPHLVRHGEALPDESGLSENGRRQAELLGRRLAEYPISAVHHGPPARAAQTARLIGEHLPAAELRRTGFPPGPGL